MDVCIGNDSPPAGSTEVLGGNDSPPAGSTSFPPQEDQAQGAGDDVDHPMDVTLDSSPHAQSTDVSDGDGARPLREAAEERQGRETPGTPKRAAGGAAGPGPEASGRTPTASSPAYSADAMAARLAVIPLEGQTVEDVAAAVVAACQEFGVEVRRFDSKKSSKEPGARLTVVGLACKHAMKNRQKEYLAGDAANGVKRRKSSSQRTQCMMKGYIRWPVRGEHSEHPYLAFKTLDHNHQVDKDVVDEVRRQTKPLDTPTKDACGKLTDAGFKPAVQGRMIEALTGERPNTRAIQNHAAAHRRRKTPYDTVAVGGTWQAIPENATIESRLQRVAQTGQSSQDRGLLYVEMLKKATAAVSFGVQLVPPDTMRAIVQTFESSINTAAMISSGQGAVLGNPQAVRQPAVRSQGTREKSSAEYGGAKGRRRAQANHT